MATMISDLNAMVNLGQSDKKAVQEPVVERAEVPKIPMEPAKEKEPECSFPPTPEQLRAVPSEPEKPAVDIKPEPAKDRRRRSCQVPGDYDGMDMGDIDSYVDAQKWSDATKAVSRTVLKRFRYLLNRGNTQQGAYDKMCENIKYEGFVNSRIKNFYKHMDMPLDYERKFKEDRSRKKTTFADL